MLAWFSWTIFWETKEIFSVQMYSTLQQKVWFLICVCFIKREAKTYQHADAKHTFTFVLPNQIESMANVTFDSTLLLFSFIIWHCCCSWVQRSVLVNSNTILLHKHVIYLINTYAYYTLSSSLTIFRFY